MTQDNPWPHVTNERAAEQGTYPVYEAGDALCFYAGSPIPLVCLECGSVDNIERAPAAVTGARGRVTRTLTTSLPFCAADRKRLMRKWRAVDIVLLFFSVSLLPAFISSLGQGDFKRAVIWGFCAAIPAAIVYSLRIFRNRIPMKAEWIDDDHMMRLRGVHPEARRIILAGSKARL